MGKIPRIAGKKQQHRWENAFKPRAGRFDLVLFYACNAFTNCFIICFLCFDYLFLYVYVYTLNNFSNWSLLFCCYLDIYQTNWIELYSVLYRIISVKMSHSECCAVTSLHFRHLSKYTYAVNWCVAFYKV